MLKKKQNHQTEKGARHFCLAPYQRGITLLFAGKTQNSMIEKTYDAVDYRAR